MTFNGPWPISGSTTLLPLSYLLSDFLLKEDPWLTSNIACEFPYPWIRSNTETDPMTFGWEFYAPDKIGTSHGVEKPESESKDWKSFSPEVIESYRKSGEMRSKMADDVYTIMQRRQMKDKTRTCMYTGTYGHLLFGNILISAKRKQLKVRLSSGMESSLRYNDETGSFDMTLKGAIGKLMSRITSTQIKFEDKRDGQYFKATVTGFGEAYTFERGVDFNSEPVDIVRPQRIPKRRNFDLEATGVFGPEQRPERRYFPWWNTSGTLLLSLIDFR